MNTVFLPGWGMKGEVFSPLVEALAPPTCTVVEWEGIEAVECFRKRAEQALAAPSLLIGWSLGTLVALEMAHAFPERVTKLVLISGTSRFVADNDYPSGWHSRIVERMKKQLKKHPEETLTSFGSSLWAEGETGDISEVMHRDRLEELTIGLDYLVTADARPWLSQLHMPVLLLHGENDGICPPEAARYIAERVPNAKFVLLPNTGHVPFWTKTRECTYSIRTWGGEIDD
ncbi:alpha/beta fold hydrolase [Anoxybacteroides amylolyticum]|uniref:Serine hydrolase family protein n=1 Tax=Anoxybacteroides amylolyticum TaxID=294699 RepID=A0A160F5C7_9BACL|nr:alpha/beta fold hydrolase [Anoxybacillus amylolyticus]ANB61045.1 serine hydrolase family protein [Anoxybacillus amylolyticus]